MAEEDDAFLSYPDLDSEYSIPMLFDRTRHVCYLEMMLDLLPSPYQSQEINRLTLAYFAVRGLDILHSSIDAIPNGSHLASTYCALSILKTLGYDFSLLDSMSIIKSMKNLQQHDGSFMPIHSGAETDLRFVYCAAAIPLPMLENWSGIDKEKAKEYIINCQSYDGGFGLTPGSESHGLRSSKDLAHKFIDYEGLRKFLFTCQSQYGGFGVKTPRAAARLYHYMDFVHLVYRSCYESPRHDHSDFRSSGAFESRRRWKC
ncbi:hypothetical protein HAX54_008803 [Datura stramonium]|uniref:Prenyltransferase alpha-alpha toroid domain-containing protein n=1 Tax=Datura stramonium TaxID=4076 RepID=A0ABS8TFG1_DATST|nr:hypothetical protein [Datura stramonium]